MYESGACCGSASILSVSSCTMRCMASNSQDRSQVEGRQPVRIWLDVPSRRRMSEGARRTVGRLSPSAGTRRGQGCRRWSGVLLDPRSPILLPGEDRSFGTNLFVDLVPSSCWFTNARSCVVSRTGSVCYGWSRHEPQVGAKLAVAAKIDRRSVGWKFTSGGTSMIDGGCRAELIGSSGNEVHVGV
jgi:hypothetical protein